MGQVCSSQGAVASTAPKEVEVDLKTPRIGQAHPDDKKAAAAAAPSPCAVTCSCSQAAAPAAPPSAADRAPGTVDHNASVAPAATAPELQHAPAEPKPFVDHASVLKPVIEESLLGAGENQNDAGTPTAVHGSSVPSLPVDVQQKELNPPTANSCTIPADQAPTQDVPAAADSTEPQAALQDSAQNDAPHQHDEPAAADSTEPQAAVQDRVGDHHDASAGDNVCPSKEHSAVAGGRASSGGAAATQISIQSNSSVSGEHSSLTTAAAPDALFDDVSQSVLKGAPSAQMSATASRTASDTLAAGHSTSSNALSSPAGNSHGQNDNDQQPAQEHSHDGVQHSEHVVEESAGEGRPLEKQPTMDSSEEQPAAHKEPDNKVHQHPSDDVLKASESEAHHELTHDKTVELHQQSPGDGEVQEPAASSESAELQELHEAKLSES